MKLLSHSAWWILNKQITREFGAEASLFLSILCDKSEYADLDGWFPCTADYVERATGMSSHIQRKAATAFKGAGLIEQAKKGVPGKNHYRVNDAQLLKFLGTTSQRFKPQAAKKIENINGSNNSFNNSLTRKAGGKIQIEKELLKGAKLIYEEFHKREVGPGPRFDAASVGALKKILYYFDQQVRGAEQNAGKDTDAIAELILQAWCTILAPGNWKALRPFLRDGVKLLRINSNLEEIIKSIRDVAGKNETKELAGAAQNWYNEL